MEMTKQLGTLVEEATSDSHTQPPLAIYDKVLALINSRVDMYDLSHPGPNIPSTQSPNA